MQSSSFVYGVLSSITAAIIIIIFKNQIANIVNLLFLKVYPKVKGKYKIEFLENRVDKKQKDIITFHQFGNKIWGINETFENYKLVDQDKIKGKVTASRIVTFEFESISENHHNFGTGIFRISSTNVEMSGYITCLCVQCQDTTSIKVKLVKVDDKK